MVVASGLTSRVSNLALYQLQASETAQRMGMLDGVGAIGGRAICEFVDAALSMWHEIQ